ncbi:MAG: chromate transporter [Dehalococcoidia bacterium]
MNSDKRILLSLFAVFLRIGAFTWGGGYAMLPLIKNELVEKRKWITPRDFIDGIVVSQSVPGAVAINLATFTGNKIAGNLGAIVAAIGTALPSFVSIVVISIFFLRFRELSVVQSFFKGATPAIAAILVGAIVDLGKDALKGYKEIIIAIGLLLLLLFLHMHPVLAIVIAVILGLFVRRQW